MTVDDIAAISYVPLKKEAYSSFKTSAWREVDEVVIIEEEVTFFDWMKKVLATCKHDWISFAILDEMPVAELFVSLAECKEKKNVSIYQTTELLGAPLAGLTFRKELAEKVLKQWKPEDEGAFIYLLLVTAKTIQVANGPFREVDFVERTKQVLAAEDNCYQKRYLIRCFLEQKFAKKVPNEQGISEIIQVLSLLEVEVINQMPSLCEYITAIISQQGSGKCSESILLLVSKYTEILTSEKKWLPPYSGLFKVAKKKRYRPKMMRIPSISNFHKRLAQYIGRKIVYPLAKRLPVQPDKVLFLSKKTVHPDDTFWPLYHEIKQQKKTKKVAMYFLAEDFRFSYFWRFFYDLGRSKYLFVDDYYYPFYNITIREEATVVQLWHAAGAFKKFGHSAIGHKDSLPEEFETRAHQNYSYVIASSDSVKAQYAEAFQMDKVNVLPLGLPRLWKLFDADYKAFNQRRFKEEYPSFKNKKILLYAPTFRGNTEQRSELKVPLHLKALRNSLGEEYVLLIKLHPHIDAISLDISEAEGFAFDVSNQNIMDLMLLADVLITDYSSVITEFALLEKPIIFYAYDLASYLEERDFFEDYESYVPGPIVQTEKELINCLQVGVPNVSKASFNARNFTYQDGHAAERIIKRVMPD